LLAEVDRLHIDIGQLGAAVEVADVVVLGLGLETRVKSRVIALTGNAKPSQPETTKQQYDNDTQAQAIRNMA